VQWLVWALLPPPPSHTRRTTRRGKCQSRAAFVATPRALATAPPRVPAEEGAEAAARVNGLNGVTVMHWCESDDSGLERRALERRSTPTLSLRVDVLKLVLVLMLVLNCYCSLG
jgi:hypothetical protein